MTKGKKKKYKSPLHIYVGPRNGIISPMGQIDNIKSGQIEIGGESDIRVIVMGTNHKFLFVMIF